MAYDFEAIAAEHFGIRAGARAIPGEIDTNVRLDAADGSVYVLRLSPPGTDVSVLDFQSKVLRALEQLPDVRVPHLVRSRSGEPVEELTDGRLARVSRGCRARHCLRAIGRRRPPTRLDARPARSSKPSPISTIPQRIASWRGTCAALRR